MANLTDHAEKLLLDYLMTAEVVTRPTAWYLALFTAAPSDAGGGAEVSGAGYARQPIAFTAAATPAGSTANNASITFTASGGDFGSVSHIAIFDAEVGGNALWTGALGAARTVNNGDNLTFGIGAVNTSLA